MFRTTEQMRARKPLKLAPAKFSRGQIASAAVCLGIVISLSTTAFGDGLIRSAGINIASILGDRSPGARTSANLIKDKRSEAPGSRALARTGTRQSPVDLGALVEAAAPAIIAAAPENLIGSPLLMAGLAPLPALDGFQTPDFVSFPGTGFGSTAGGGGGGVIGLPGGGGGGAAPPGGGSSPPIDGGPIGGTPPPPGVVAAVPEPSVWLTLILGFGAIGWSIRRNRGKLCHPKRSRRAVHG
jgi:hypothetical protein